MANDRIDVDDFLDTFSEELGVNRQRAEEGLRKSKEKVARVAPQLTQSGLLGIDLGGSLGGAQDKFCGLWPKIRSAINVALKFSWLFRIDAETVGAAKAFLASFDKRFLPAICAAEDNR